MTKEKLRRIILSVDGDDLYLKYERIINYMFEIDLSTAYIAGAKEKNSPIPVDIQIGFDYCSNKPNCKSKEETDEFIEKYYSLFFTAFERYLDMSDRDYPLKQRLTNYADSVLRQRYTLNYLSLNTYSIQNNIFSSFNPFGSKSIEGSFLQQEK